MNRLIQVQNGTAAQQENYAYDPLNNRVKRTVNSTTPVVTAFTFDAANQLTKATNAAGTSTLLGLVYDAAGNVTKGRDGGTGGTASLTGSPATDCTATGAANSIVGMTYDNLNRMTQATRTGAGAITESYGYDDTGRRIRKVSGAVTTYSVYQGSDANAEYATWANPAAVYTYGPGTDMPVIRAAVTGTATYGQALYYHADGLGSIVGISNNTNTTTNTQRFDAWGNVLSGTVPGSARFGYTGREPDASGLTYYRARYYDPAVGRFTQRDPIGLQGGLNQYGYVGNNPINFTDPLGLHPASPIQVADASAILNYFSNKMTDTGQSLVNFSKKAVNVVATGLGDVLDGCGDFCDPGWQMSTGNALGPYGGADKLLGVAFGGLRTAANLGKAVNVSATVATRTEETIYVRGRQIDTAVAKEWAGHSVIDIEKWTLVKNDAAMEKIIGEKGKVYLASPQTSSNLFDAANNRMTVFARELQQLFTAGYKQVGDYMFPGK